MTSVEASWSMTGAPTGTRMSFSVTMSSVGVELAVGAGVAGVPGPLVGVDLDRGPCSGRLEPVEVPERVVEVRSSS